MCDFFIIIALIVGVITLILLYGSLAFAVFGMLYEWYVKKIKNSNKDEKGNRI